MESKDDKLIAFKNTIAKKKQELTEKKVQLNKEIKSIEQTEKEIAGDLIANLTLDKNPPYKREHFDADVNKNYQDGLGDLLKHQNQLAYPSEDSKEIENLIAIAQILYDRINNRSKQNPYVVGIEQIIAIPNTKIDYAYEALSKTIGYNPMDIEGFMRTLGTGKPEEILPMYNMLFQVITQKAMKLYQPDEGMTVFNQLIKFRENDRFQVQKEIDYVADVERKIAQIEAYRHEPDPGFDAILSEVSTLEPSKQASQLGKALEFLQSREECLNNLKKMDDHKVEKHRQDPQINAYVEKQTKLLLASSDIEDIKAIGEQIQKTVEALSKPKGQYQIVLARIAELEQKLVTNSMIPKGIRNSINVKLEKKIAQIKQALYDLPVEKRNKCLTEKTVLVALSINRGTGIRTADSFKNAVKNVAQDEIQEVSKAVNTMKKR